MRFANPAMLYLLLPVVLVALSAFFVWSWRKHQALMAQFIHARLLSSLTVGVSPGRQKFKMACIVFSIVCLVLALARPQWGFEWEEVKQKGLDIVIAIDVSKSMLAEDIAPSRLARAKLAALDLMQQARSDRLGLVAFAGAAFLQCPLTIDDSAFRQSVDALDVNTIPEGGTALAEAIETAQAAFKEGDNHRVLVIFTDGEDHDSGAVEAAKKAGETGMQIFTIGIGSAEGEILRIKDAKGRSDYIRDEQGNVVKSHLNESLLQDIAKATSRGFYLRLQGPQAIDALYREGLAPLPKSESGERLVRRYYERYHWPLALAMIFLVLEMLVPERKSQRARPVQMQESGRGPGRPSRRRENLAGIGAAVIALLLTPLVASGSSASALREYNAGKYDQALKEYEKLLKTQKNADPRLHFNAGAAAYQSKSFDEARKQFDQALNSSDLQLVGKAYYNRGNTLYQLGVNNPDMDGRKKLWEDALKDFDSTMQLNRQDPDAKNNYQFVKQQLEELKQKQQQQQQQQDQQQKQDDKQNQDQNQNQQQQQDQNKDNKDQQQKEQQAKNQPEENHQTGKEQQEKKNQQAKNDKKDQQQKQDQASANEKKKQDGQKSDQQQQQQPNASKNKQGQPGEKGEEGQAYAVGQMTPQQAQQLLDAQKNEEMLLPVRPDGKPRENRGPIKDW